MSFRFVITYAAVLLAFGATAFGATGCDDGGGSDAGFDSGPPVDAGIISSCPTSMVPAPEELMGPCCWRTSNADRQDAPEMRLTFFDITGPAGSPLASSTLGRVLNEAMQDENFNWLVRTEVAGTAVTITTGFGRRVGPADYQFSQGSAGAAGDPDAWCPVVMTGALAGETITANPIMGAVTVPVFDETGAILQVELTIREITIETATWTEQRSCIGEKTNRPFVYTPAGTLSGYIEVAASRTLEISVPPIMTTVCAAVAGSLSDATYCDTVSQDMWTTPPDSLCDATGCVSNAETPGTCEPGTTCNAWQLIADFAAAGVDITNDACP